MVTNLNVSRLMLHFHSLGLSWWHCGAALRFRSRPERLLGSVFGAGFKWHAPKLERPFFMVTPKSERLLPAGSEIGVHMIRGSSEIGRSFFYLFRNILRATRAKKDELGARSPDRNLVPTGMLDPMLTSPWDNIDQPPSVVMQNPCFSRVI